MRISGLVLGFSAGAYLVWKVAIPTPDAPVSCSVAADCPVANAASLNTTPAEQSDLRVVVYDPATEPRARVHEGSHIPGWTSAEEASLTHRLAVSPVSEGTPLPRLRIVGLDQANAHGACAVLGERKIGCLALTNLSEK